jgi:hypothetical protein
MGVAMEMAVEEAGLMVVSRKRGAPANGDAPTGTDATAEQQRWLIQSGRLRCGALLHTGHSQSDAPDCDLPGQNPILGGEMQVPGWKALVGIAGC